MEPTGARRKLGINNPIIGRYKKVEIGDSVDAAKKPADEFMVTMNYFVDESGKMARLNIGLCLLVY